MQIDSAFNNTQITPAKVDDVTSNAFNKLDPNKTGSFDKATFEKVFNQISGGNPSTSALADSIFQSLDINGSGQVDKNEFANGVSSYMSNVQQGGSFTSTTQALFGAQTAGGVQSLLSGNSASPLTSSETPAGSSKNPVDILMQALDSSGQSTSAIQSTQDYLDNLNKQSA